MSDLRLPYVGQRLQITVDATGHQARSVVDAVGRTAQDELLLREPVDLDRPGGLDVELGAPVHLMWYSPRGRHELPASFAGLAAERVQLWRLRPTGQVTTTQQRQFTRAGDALAATVRQDEQAWSGTVIDLSEEGARCVLESATRPPVAELVVELDVDVDGRLLRLQAQVLAITSLPRQRCEVRLAFQSIGRDADLLRRRVLAQQRRARSALR